VLLAVVGDQWSVVSNFDIRQRDFSDH